MPGKEHLRGVGNKEQRQYEEIKKDAQKSGRYGDRAEEPYGQIPRRWQRCCGRSF